jgi:hypothetical protein
METDTMKNTATVVKIAEEVGKLRKAIQKKC